MTTKHKRILRGLAAVFTLGIVTLQVRAGDIVGLVSDVNSRAALPGASVTIIEAGRSEVTDTQGRFRVSGLNEGSYTVRVNYLGYEAKTESVSVPASGAVPLAVNLGEEVIKLDVFVVEGYREGRARALQQRKMAPNVKDIISSDSVGNLPDQNVAEALARVPGLNLDVDGGEGRFVTIRGIEPNLNNVTLNGATLAAPGVDGREGRSMPLDVIGSSQISQIEVIKSVTPDMDANALGGTINIKTISAFDSRDRRIYGSVEYGETRAANDDIYAGDFTFADRFGANRKLGVALSVNYSKRPYVKHDLQANWLTFNNQLYMSQFEILPTDGERKRLGLNLNLEYRPEDGTEFFVRTIYNKFNDHTFEDEIIMESRRDPVFVSPTSVTFDRMRYEIRSFEEKTEQTLFNITGGGSKRFNNLTVDGDVTYSYAKEFNPFWNAAQFRTGNVNVPELYTLDFTDFYPVFDDKGTMSAASTAYPLRRFREEDSTVEEKTYTPQFNLRWDFDNWLGGRSGYLKFGTKYTDRSRFVDDNSSRPTNGSLTLDGMNARGPGRTVWDDRYNTRITVNLPAAFAYLNSNRSLFTIDEIESAGNSVEDDYDIDEKILALYGMASVKLNDRATLLGGIRYERTDASMIGYEVRTVAGSFEGVFTNHSDFEYDHFLPNLQLRYALSERTVLRAAITSTIGRPAYEDASPISTLEYDPVLAPLNPAFPNAGSLEIGNANLSPYEALNFDLAIEHYLPSGGVLSVGVFHKKIDNPIYEYEETLRNTTYNGIAMETLDVSSMRNADSGKITGVEANVQLPFTAFTQGFFGGFGVDANATFIDSEVTLIQRTDKVPFFRQPDKIYNLGFYYQRHGIAARVAWNYQNESIRTIGADTTTDYWRGDRDQIDLQASYTFPENYTVFFQWKNITDEPNERYIGDKNRLRNSEFYGADIRVGLRFNF